MPDVTESRIDRDLEKRSANGSYIYSAAWLLIGVGTGLYQQNGRFFYTVLLVFIALGAVRLTTYAFSQQIRRYSRKLWLVIIYLNAILPALLISSLFSLSLLNPAFESLFLYLLLTLFAMLSGGIVNFSPRPDVALSYLAALLLPPFVSSVLLSSEHYLEAAMMLAYGVFMFVLSRRLCKEYEQLIEHQADLEKLNNQDSLTGIANRRAFDESLDLNWVTHVRTQANLSLMLIDIDHFKSINDNYGHAAGDKVIQAVANAIKSVCKRQTDSIARIGGEEFAVLISVSEQHQISILAEKTRASIASLDVEFEGQMISLTVSIGVATCIPGRQSRPSELFNMADKLLYKAKDAGRNKVVVE